MFQFFNKPYPFNDDLKHNAKVIFFITIGILAFLLIFQPVDLRSFTNIQIFHLATGVVVSTFLTLSLNLIVLPSFLPRMFFNKKWVVWKEILWNLWILIIISGSHFLFYSKLFYIFEIDFYIIVRILILAIIPVSVLITVNQTRLLRSNLKSALSLNDKLAEKEQLKEKMIFFESEYKKDSLTVKVNSLLFVKASDNYIEVYYLDEKKIKNTLVRSTLKRAQQICKSFDFIFRCHRTFIININHIQKITGTSQGYKLFFNNINFPVPVSRKYINEFKKLI